MKFVEKEAATVEEAIELALLDLDANELEVDIEVLEESKKALFGLFGGKQARVKVTKRVNVEDTARQFLSSVLSSMGIETKLSVKLKQNSLYIDMAGKEMALLIGRRGQTLDSLQYLVSLVVNKNRDEYIRVILDTENYRQKRKDTLEKLAFKLANRAKKIKKDITLEPMNPYERRIIHSALQNNKFVSTRSEGDEPYRKVVIFLNK
ncbi:protein jag [Acidaminobacter sp. JC074]|uniref:RNA-binding cell elongation regulator Jag/EloR n=1 Tax=Acidaminobacter sp. JC074 TaxID=2530199 RepID=UPI001F10F08F|nr:RNA-binding cell elongation regulator Jag/EloR [Acidaminobacter sp. JC074]MCH4891234.1 protein jag [Acidaminobacter sp. JC074]